MESAQTQTHPAWCVIYGVGIIFFLVLYGIFQEGIMTVPYDGALFQYSVFLVLCNRLAAVVFGLVMAVSKGEQLTNQAPLWKYLIVSLSNVYASTCQYEALKYVSFAVQMLGKSFKMMPVMIWGMIISGKSYGLRDWGVALAVTLGCTEFLMTGPTNSKVDSGNSMWGFVLLGGFLALDGLTSTFQEKLFKEHQTTKYNQMVYINSLSATVSTVTLLATGDLVVLETVSYSDRVTLIQSEAALDAFLRLHPEGSSKPRVILVLSDARIRMMQVFSAAGEFKTHHFAQVGASRWATDRFKVRQVPSFIVVDPATRQGYHTQPQLLRSFSGFKEQLREARFLPELHRESFRERCSNWAAPACAWAAIFVVPPDALGKERGRTSVRPASEWMSTWVGVCSQDLSGETGDEEVPMVCCRNFQLPSLSELFGWGTKSRPMEFQSPVGEGLLAFYYPGYNTPADEVCQAAFLGNFYARPLEIRHAAKPEMVSFENAEAAFQCLKHWDKKELFQKASAEDWSSMPIRGVREEAYKLNRKSQGENQCDWTYAGYGSNWAGMRHVLQQKFQDEELRQMLLATENAFLLEHNPKHGRDTVWSNNNDGTGQNWLGLQLMWLREARCSGDWANWLRQHVDFSTGAMLPDSEWPKVVKRATEATLQALAEAS
eukprot:g596.t1